MPARLLVAPLAAALAASLVAGGALGSASAAPAPAASPYSLSAGSPSPGSPGAGDPYFPLDGNGGYDVVHYDIADTYDTPTGDLSGQTTVTAVATQDLSRFDLDLVLSTDSVSVDGQPAAYHGGAHELVVTPATPIADGQQFSVTVGYHGTPGSISYGGESPWQASTSEAVAMGEPHIAPWWFAANDYPDDKATYDVTVTVPHGEQVVANGQLVSHTSDSDWTTWHWRMGQPISSYLAFFAAGSFAIRSGVREGLPYTYAASKQSDVDYGLKLLNRTGHDVSWLARQFGDYPFGSTGGVFTSIRTGFSLENATRPTYSPLASRLTVVHELSHQWFGDDVSVARWRDVWLNEGFARWTEWHYQESHGGPDAQHHMVNAYGAVPANDPFWTVRIGNPGAAFLFDDPVYERGAMAVQALRHRIGERDFDALLHGWIHDHAGSNATVVQFEQLAADVSGQDLDGFFRAWLYKPVKPAETAENGF